MSSKRKPIKSRCPVASTSAGLPEVLFSDFPGPLSSSSKSTLSFESFHWLPVKTTAGSLVTDSFAIKLPFSEVSAEDVPDVLKLFGGQEKVATILGNPRENQRRLVFDLRPDHLSSSMFSCSNPLSRSAEVSNGLYLSTPALHPFSSESTSAVSVFQIRN